MAPMARRTCQVSVKGLKEESEHEVTVEADTLYEAAVRGLAALRQGSWSAADAQATACVVVTVQPPAVSHRVKLADLTAWLEGSGKSPADRLERQRLRTLLYGKTPA